MKRKVVSPLNNIWIVDFINKSSIISDEEFQNAILILQKQINRHFLPAWSIGAQLDIVLSPRQNATIYLLDDSDSPGILGFHDITVSETPIGFVFARTAKREGDSWTFAASHELMEILVDPYANLLAEGQFQGSPALFAYEICDPVEADGGYMLNGVQVANFVFPSWFINQTAQQYDYLDLLDAPFTIGSNGSLSFYRSIGEWVDISNNRSLTKIHPKHSRRFRRMKRTNHNYGLYEKHPEYRQTQVKD